ncbi:response regulator [Marinilongibacter aquaticus]|uniref:hybrid sensor histidine kinase/response regulator transcription factor n=1 Tax=Marinilongibacter aquaticus TaxID=2975157 RepID=UPI0021BD006C|nr:ATP-binding protein [Marinilongibacter aquaticus]UBM58798.1 response regulator [Marinilongibacter aquaticus]
MKRSVLVIFLLKITLGYPQGILTFSKIENLPNQWINTIAQDSLGFVWIGTEDGLCRFDGNNIKVVRHSIEERNSLAANAVYDIFALKDKELLIGTQGGGISRFNLFKREFRTLNKYPGGKIFYAKEFHELNAGTYVVLYDEGILLFNTNTDTFKKVNMGTTNSKIAVVDTDSFWISTGSILYKYSVSKDQIVHKKEFQKPINMLVYSANQLLLAFDDSIASYTEQGIQKRAITDSAILHSAHFGERTVLASKTSLYNFDFDSFRLSSIRSSIDFGNYGINTLFFDRHNQLWVGTERALFKSKSMLSIFKTQTIPLHARRIIKHRDKLYIGGINGLYKIDSDRKPVRVLDGHILALNSIGPELWVTTLSGDVIKLERDSVEKRIALGSSDNIFRIYGLEQDSNGKIWVGCWSKGIVVLNGNGGLLKEIPLNALYGIEEAKILKMFIDSKDRLWMATAANGIFMLPNVSSYDPEGETLPVRHYTYKSEDINSINSNILFSIEEDRNNLIWFSTDLGIAYYDEKKDNFKRLRIDGKLFDKKVMTIRCDAHNNLWMSSIGNGLYVYLQSTNKIINYTTDSGLISNAFLFTSGYFDGNTNTLYFGTDTGIQTIELNRPTQLNAAQRPLITDLKINGESRDFIRMPYQNKISLTHKENDMAIQFSSLDLEHAINVDYSYSLDDNPWHAMEAQTVYFSNLNYGKHILRVKSNYNINLLDRDKNLSEFAIAIRPPWYRTTMAYVIYFLLVLGSAALVIHLFLKSKIAHIETQKTREINRLQSKMYANISHEFRTPLTVIGGLSKSLQKNDSQTGIVDKAKHIEKSSNRLLSLVNQMLDLVSLDAKKMELSYKQGDIIPFIKTVVSYYNALAEPKNINLRFSSETKTQIMDFDDDKLQKVMNNLLSNALKFTQRDGAVLVNVKKEDEHIEIRVRDTGTGIGKEHLPHVFNRYYKTFDLDKNLGSGIGMALTKELVELMSGSISVESEPGKGSLFSIRLPITNKADLATPKTRLPFVEREESPKEGTNGPDQHVQAGTVFSILIVEDNYEIRQYLKQLLHGTYRIYTATNGDEGIKTAQKKSIDFIISDVSMPKMDGFEFCQKIKQNIKTSHIPFIMVSARTQTESKLKGYTLGADAYLYKPFNERELLLIIGNLLKRVEHTKSHFGHLLQIRQSKQASVQQIDIDFIKQLQTYALSKSTKIPIDELAKSLHISRSQMHRKIKALTGKSTTLYINSIRLEKAKTLLSSTDLNISEIAYEVNFDDVAYFSKTFRKVHGSSPSEYRENHKK